jgi:hypothetical protein
MPTINQLPVLNTISSGDQLPVYSPNNGDARRTSIGSLLTFFQQSFASPTVSTNLYTPGTGFNITVPTPVSEQQWMLLQPAGTLASGTITLPLNTGVPDGTQVLITTTQKITAFTLALNGAAAGYAFPTSLLAGAGFTVRYYQATNSWYNISAELQYIFQDIFVNTINGLILGLGGGNVANNIAIGDDSLLANTVGFQNTAVGDSTLKANTTGDNNTAIGRIALFSNVIGDNHTAIGTAALSLATGNTNTCVGYLSGSSITTGSKNTILGSYNGNQGGLNIIAASNYIVLSDGDGNPRAYWNGANATFNGSLTATGLATTGAITGDTLVLSGASGSLNATSISSNNAITANNTSIATFIAMSGSVGTIASASTIAPVKEITYISGTAAIATITPQMPITGTNGTIILIPTGAFTWTTAGNIAIAGTAVVGRALHMTYTAITDKWYPSYV